MGNINIMMPSDLRKITEAARQAQEQTKTEANMLAAQQCISSIERNMGHAAKDGQDCVRITTSAISR